MSLRSSGLEYKCKFGKSKFGSLTSIKNIFFIFTKFTLIYKPWILSGHKWWEETGWSLRSTSLIPALVMLYAQTSGAAEMSFPRQTGLQKPCGHSLEGWREMCFILSICVWMCLHSWDEVISHHHLRQSVNFLSHPHESNPASHEGAGKLMVEGAAWPPAGGDLH